MYAIKYIFKSSKAKYNLYSLGRHRIDKPLEKWQQNNLIIKITFVCA